MIKFRGDHTPVVLTGETQEMQEKAAPAEESFFQTNEKGLHLGEHINAILLLKQY